MLISAVKLAPETVYEFVAEIVANSTSPKPKLVSETDKIGTVELTPLPDTDKFTLVAPLLTCVISSK